MSEFAGKAEDHIHSGESGTTPDSKVHGANMGPIWGRQDPGGSHVGPMNLAISDVSLKTQAIVISLNVFSLGPITNDVSVVIQIWCKINSVPIQVFKYLL